MKQVGGDKVATLTLIPSQLDPHTYELVKGDNEKLIYADLIVANGLGLEHGPSLRSYLEGSENVLAVGDLIRQDDPGSILFVDGLPDPHIWTDVSMWSRIVPHIASALANRDPSNAELYWRNAEDLQIEMAKVDAQLYQTLQAIPDSSRYLVTSHDAFNYFTRRYLASPSEQSPTEWDSRFEAPEGLAPEAQLSAVDIERIIDHMERHQITVLFPESNVSQDSIRKIVSAGKSRGLNLHIATTHLYGDAMGDPGSDADSYLKMAQHNANTIGSYLRKNGVPLANGKQTEESRGK